MTMPSVAEQNLRTRLKARSEKTDQTASYITDYHRRLPRPCPNDCQAIGLRQQLDEVSHANLNLHYRLDACASQLASTRLALALTVSAATVGLLLLYAYVISH